VDRRQAPKFLARSAGPLAIPHTLRRPLGANCLTSSRTCPSVALTFAVVLMARYAANWKLYSVSAYVNLLRTVIPEGHIGVLLKATCL
jgi:hypothetical protein